MNEYQAVKLVNMDAYRRYCAERNMRGAEWLEGRALVTNGARKNGCLYVQSGCLSAYVPLRFVRFVRS